MKPHIELEISPLEVEMLRDYREGLAKHRRRNYLLWVAASAFSVGLAVLIAKGIL